MQPQSGVASMATDVQSHTPPSFDEQTPYSSEGSIELLLQVLGQSTPTVDRNIIPTSTTLLQPTLGDSHHEGRLVSNHRLLGA
jgi:hypothetical protein